MTQNKTISKSSPFNPFWLITASKAAQQRSCVVSKTFKSPFHYLITTLPGETSLAGTLPLGPLRTCLVVVWLVSRGRAAGTKDTGRSKIDEQRIKKDKRKTQKRGEGSVSAWMQTSWVPDKYSRRRTGRAAWVRQREGGWLKDLVWLIRAHCLVLTRAELTVTYSHICGMGSCSGRP